MLSKEVLINNDHGFQRLSINITLLNEHAPSEKKYNEQWLLFKNDMQVGFFFW